MENKHVSASEFSQMFKAYFKEWFSGCNIATLVKQEDILSQLIDSDFGPDFILIDEVIVLYDLVRDECVNRLVLSIRGD